MNNKRPIHYFSAIGLLTVVIMLSLFLFHEKVDRYTSRENFSYSVLTDYEYTSYEDPNAPLGIVEEYRWTITEAPPPSSCLTFYLVHQYAEVYVDDELLFSLSSNPNNLFAKTIGCAWAKAFIYASDINKQVRILVYPVYEATIARPLTIYYGSLNAVVANMIDLNLFSIIFGIVAIVIGVAFILFTLINIKNLEADKSVAALGCFSMFTGLWKLSDSEVIPFLFENLTTFFSAVATISVTLMLLSFIIFTTNQFSQKTFFVWKIICIIDMIIGIVFCLLQIFNIADLKDTLSISHAMIVVDIIALLITFIWEALNHRLTPKLKTTALCFLLISSGAILDLTLYYTIGLSSQMMLCLLAFLAYIIIIGFMTVKEALMLINRGKEAKKYQHLAIHDQMTGLYNRTFWTEYIQAHKYDDRACYIIMLDINELKLCNDTLGHDAGDRLLINSANLMKQAFLPNGIPIRLGGDEFCIVLNEILDSTCRSYLKIFLSSIERFNKDHPEEYPIQIAYGYSKYNPKTDVDFNETLRRADKKMYEKKLEMKLAK